MTTRVSLQFKMNAMINEVTIRPTFCNSMVDRSTTTVRNKVASLSSCDASIALVLLTSSNHPISFLNMAATKLICIKFQKSFELLDKFMVFNLTSKHLFSNTKSKPFSHDPKTRVCNSMDNDSNNSATTEEECNFPNFPTCCVPVHVSGRTIEYSLFEEMCTGLIISAPSPPNLLTDFSERKLAPKLLVVRDNSREYLMLPSREYLMLHQFIYTYQTREKFIQYYDEWKRLHFK
ncbi:basic-leucine zipper transcription factor family protein [Striga asiatica]|uniref:Basic-leucine zipper transcription factor family protein n=1 Tax=Striga asiatica TaxID=4170 RepID=A0A5A7PPX9_STRAF|nr:basic-leucine zipper transcription factor family protein [Striga asiatica]